jgi:integrase/recombinase XerC
MHIGEEDDVTVEGSGPRDVSALQLPARGGVERDEAGVWRMTGAGGEPVLAVQWFLADLAATDAADSTLRSYAYDLLRWFRFLSAIDVEWRRATRRDVRDFVRWFREAPNSQRVRGDKPSSRPVPGTLNPRTGKTYLAAGYAPRTINHALSVVSAFYTYAVDAGLGPPRNPVTGVNPSASDSAAGVRRRAALRQKEPRHQPRDIPDDLLAKVINELSCERDRALVAVALGSGLRASELLSMTCGGIDAGRGVVRVVPKGGLVPIWVPSTPESFVQISRYLLSRRDFRLFDPLWVTRRTPVRPLTYFALRQILERVNARLGTNITWHDLRHTFTHQLLSDKSVGVSDVQQLLRHRDLNTLSSYSTTRVDELAQRLRAVDAQPKPAAFAGDGYNEEDLQTLFPGVSPPPAGRVE